jgi:hypothetical protein
MTSFFIIPLFISSFVTSNVFGQDESETYIYLVDSEPFGIPYTSGQNHGGTGWLAYLQVPTLPSIWMVKNVRKGMHYKYPVFFLAGSLNDTASRDCTVPSDVSIFFPATTPIVIILSQ